MISYLSLLLRLLVLLHHHVGHHENGGRTGGVVVRTGVDLSARARVTGTEVAEAEDTEVVTIEGLSEDGSHPVQKAWKQHAVPQLLDVASRSDWP